MTIAQADPLLVLTDYRATVQSGGVIVIAGLDPRHAMEIGTPSFVQYYDARKPEDTQSTRAADWNIRLNSSLEEEFGRDPSAFLKLTLKVEQERGSQSALVFIFKQMDSLLRKRHFGVCNKVLAEVRRALAHDEPQLSEDVAVGFLTATLPAARLLDGRSLLLRDVDSMLQRRGIPGDDILAGL